MPVERAHDFTIMTDSPLYWHIHHDILAEPLTEPIENRIRFIKNNKPYHEVETRLRLMKPVRGKLPELDKAGAEFVKAYAESNKAGAEWDKACVERDNASAEWNMACAERDKASAEWDKACAEWGKAYAEFVKVRAERDKARAKRDKACAKFVKASAEWDKARADPAVLSLHAKECPNCPWNGRTILP